MKKFFVLFFLFSKIQAYAAATLSIPEECFAKEISPCLIKANEDQVLKNQSGTFAFAVEENTIFKIIEFKPAYRFELLQGKLSPFVEGKKSLGFQLNGVRFDSARVFAEMTPERKMRVYDSRKFILSDYELSSVQSEETVIVRAEFLAKFDMIRYLSGYFTNKKSLMSYLKSIEPFWKREFEAQTKNQTMVLKRSLASIEKNEEDRKRRQEKEASELKKVRERFFYRTFYR